VKTGTNEGSFGDDAAAHSSAAAAMTILPEARNATIASRMKAPA
jgi:hypothetical protein